MYMKFLEKRLKADQHLPGAGGESRGWQQTDDREILGVMEVFLSVVIHSQL